jgi:type I restriction enzyme, S subunit
MKGWSTTTLGEIADGPQGFIDGPFGSNLPASDYVEQGIPVIRGSDLSLGLSRFHAHEFVFVSSQTADRLMRSNARPGDIIFTKKGTIGQTGLVPNNLPFSLFLLSSNQMRLRVDQNKADPLFVYYYVSQKACVEKVIRDSEATGVPKTNLTYFRTFPIHLPPLEEQRAIASILGAVDDKIEINRRINDTLNATARAIFKDWFVDFGPTRARQRGQAPYLPSELWSLFPSRIDDKGRPEGWTEKRVDDVLELAYGKALKSSERIGGSIPVYGSGGITGYHNEPLVEGPSIIIGRKGTVGSLYWEDRPFFPIDTVFFVKPKAPLTFCYYHLETLRLEGMNTDAAVPGLNRNNVYRLPVPWGPPELRSCFDVIVSPLRDLMKVNKEENETLVKIRDLLLLKLLSGTLRVRGAEEIIENVKTAATVPIEAV